MTTVGDTLRRLHTHKTVRQSVLAPEQRESTVSGHSKIDKTKTLMTSSSLMKIESIAECSLGAFCNTFDLH